MSGVFHPIFIYLAVAIGFAAVTLLISHRIPRVHKTDVKLGPYECGHDPVGDARAPFDVRFYRIAIEFLIFDLEVLLLFPGAVAFGKLALGDESVRATMLTPFIGIMVFVGLLVVGFIYSWRKGSFRWR